MELSLKDLKELFNETNKKQSFLEVGENYLIRTVTMIYTGKLKKEIDDSILLSNCCWIPETKRWHNTLQECDFTEVEPYINDVIIYKGCIIDITKLEKLPREQK